jgi:hypothetical protein
LRAHSIDQVLSTQVSEVRSFLVIRKVRANSLSHDQNERSIGHIQPITATSTLTRGIPHERAAWIDGQIWFVKARHCRSPVNTMVGLVREIPRRQCRLKD